VPTKDPKKKQAKQARWYENNKEKAKQKVRDHYERMKADPEKWAAYKARRKEYLKGYHERTREERSQKAANHYQQNREAVLARNKEWREKNKGRHHAAVRDAQRLRLYGVTREQYDNILASQGGVCALCGAPPPRNAELCLDHCHDSSRVRGILCQRCNKALHALEDPKWVQRAQAYLKKG